MTTPPASPAPRAAALDVARQLVGRVVNLALGVVVTALVVRTLGEEDFGRWSTLLVLVQVADYLSSLGLEQVAVRFAAAEPDEERRQRWVDGLVSLRLALALPLSALIAVALLLFEPDPDLRLAGVLLAGTVLAGAPGAVRVRFQLITRNDVPIAVETFASVAWGVAVVILATADGGLVAFAAAFAGVSAAASALLLALSLRLARVRLRAGRACWGELVRVGAPVGVAGLLILLYGRIDQVLVYDLAGPADAGRYGAVYRIMDQAHLVPVALMATLAPLTAAAVGDPARLRVLLTAAIRLLGIASLGGLAVSIPLSDPLVLALFGPELREAASILPVLAGAFVVVCFGYVAGNLVLLFDLQKRFVVLAVAALVVNVGANVALLGRYGYQAAAWITLATELVVVVPTLALTLRHAGLRLPVGALARTTLAALALGLALEGLEALGAPLGVLLVLAAPLYAGALVATRAFDRADVRALTARAPGASLPADPAAPPPAS